MASREPARPNILFILSDDQGAWAMRCAGNEEMVTPNLDRLAASGVRFDNFFCALAGMLAGARVNSDGAHPVSARRTGFPAGGKFAAIWTTTTPR